MCVLGDQLIWKKNYLVFTVIFFHFLLEIRNEAIHFRKRPLSRHVSCFYEITSNCLRENNFANKFKNNESINITIKNVSKEVFNKLLVHLIKSWSEVHHFLTLLKGEFYFFSSFSTGFPATCYLFVYRFVCFSKVFMSVNV